LITVGGLLALRVEEFSDVLDLVLRRFRRGRPREDGAPPPPPSLEQA
jgi:hypothetical protein